jgi:hypothetical protein
MNLTEVLICLPNVVDGAAPRAKKSERSYYYPLAVKCQTGTLEVRFYLMRRSKMGMLEGESMRWGVAILVKGAGWRRRYSKGLWIPAYAGMTVLW